MNKEYGDEPEYAIQKREGFLPSKIAGAPRQDGGAGQTTMKSWHSDTHTRFAIGVSVAFSKTGVRRRGPEKGSEWTTPGPSTICALRDIGRCYTTGSSNTVQIADFRYQWSMLHTINNSELSS